MNEIRLIMNGLIALVLLVPFFLFYIHDECKYGKPRNEYCYIVIYWTFDTGNR